MAIEIDREQRDAIYQEILTELSGSGDIWDELQSNDYEAARRTRRRLEDDMRIIRVSEESAPRRASLRDGVGGFSPRNKPRDRLVYIHPMSVITSNI